MSPVTALGDRPGRHSGMIAAIVRLARRFGNEVGIGQGMRSHNVDYYRARASEEHEPAKAAGREDVREIHEELAQQYEALIERAELRPILSIRAPKAA